MANRFWVGGAGNWNSSNTTNWSDTSGGAGGFSVPTSSDDVFFDAASGAVTVTIVGTVNCNDLDFTGFTGTLAGGVGAIALIVGNTVFDPGMSFSAGTLTTYRFSATSGTKTVTSNGTPIMCGAFQINCSGATLQLADNLELRTGNFIRTNGTFDANGQDVTLSSTAEQLISGTSITFFNLIRQPVGTGNSILSVVNSFTISGTGSFLGTATSRLYVKSTYVTVDTSKTITANAVVLDHVDFSGITGAGAATWSGTSVGDAHGNSGITFTTPVTRYWVGDGGSWSDTAHWSTSTGGASGASAPLCHDTAVFDANSFSIGAQTINLSGFFCLPTLDFTNVTNSPSISGSPVIGATGSVIYAGLSSSNAGITFLGRGNYDFDPSGLSFDNNFEMAAPGGQITMLNDFTNDENRSWTHYAGTLNANNFDMHISQFFSLFENVRQVDMGSGTWTLQGSSSYIWSISTIFQGSNATINAGTSTLKFLANSSNIIGGFQDTGRTYNNIWFTGTSNSAIWFNGGNVTLTFNDFKIDTPPKEILFQNGVFGNPTIVVSSFTVSGTVGNLVTMSCASAGQATFSKSSGVVCSDYLDLTDIHAGGGATWRAGINSVDNGNNTGWNFTSCPNNTCQFFHMF